MVRGETIPAHRSILASRSQYFDSLLFGGLKETSTSMIEMSMDTPLTAFKVLLEYMYRQFAAIFEILDRSSGNREYLISPPSLFLALASQKRGFP